MALNIFTNGFFGGQNQNNPPVSNNTNHTYQTATTFTTAGSNLTGMVGSSGGGGGPATAQYVNSVPMTHMITCENCGYKDNKLEDRYCTLCNHEHSITRI